MAVFNRLTGSVLPAVQLTPARLLIALCLLLPGLVFADFTPGVTCGGGDVPDSQAASKIAQCESNLSNYSATHYTRVKSRASHVPDYTWYLGARCPKTTSVGIYFNGDTPMCNEGCPEGQEPNPETGQCETPEPDPECTIPTGTEMKLSVSYLMGQTCYSNCIFSNPKRQICAYLSDGTTSCLAVYTSTGEYCDEDNGTSTRPFDDFTDENGCYRSTSDGKSYCEKPNDYQCPNYVMVDGKKYCRETNEDEWDSDGDGNPDSTDPSPGDPNHGGDGDDGGDDGSGGDGGDTGGDGSNGGDGESSGGEYGQGVCEPGQQITEPECEPHLDAIQCGIFLNSWNLRCEEKQRYEDFIGTDEFRESDSLTDGDNPDNTIATKEVRFSGFLDGLDDSGSGFGGARTCPPDKQINLGFGSITLPFTYICQWAEMIRPLIIALGWLSAGLIALKAMSEKE